VQSGSAFPVAVSDFAPVDVAEEDSGRPHAVAATQSAAAASTRSSRFRIRMSILTAVRGAGIQVACLPGSVGTSVIQRIHVGAPIE